MYIRELRLRTADPVRQASFYGEVLGFPILESNSHTLSFLAGATRVFMSRHPDFAPYHFAFNIPWSQIKSALHWLQQRVNVLTDRGRELIHFPAWQAQAMYFYDADGNVVEFIGRQPRQAAPGTRDFNPQSLLEVSEIGLPVVGIRQAFDTLHRHTGIEVYSGNFDNFCAIGNEQGLFICVNPAGKPHWYPTHTPTTPAAFSLEAAIGKKDYRVEYNGTSLHITPAP